MDTASVPSRSHRRPAHARRGPARPRIVSEELFRGALKKERQRADRLNRPLALLIVALKDPDDTQTPSIWVPVIEALDAITREIDVVGWSEARTAIGVILPETGTADTPHASAIEHRFRAELIRRTDADTFRRLAIHVHLHAGTKPEAEPQAREERATIYDGLKRGLDVVGSSALLALLAPLLLVIAAAVKLKSTGPVFFEQERVGQRMKPFRMLKFRTMRVGSDHQIHREYVTQFIKSEGNAQAAAAPGFFKLTTDPRVTSIGAFLRKTSLDELPQLINVLRGDMSLVGPRPPLAYEVEQYKPWHRRRVLDAKPGITGLWQVTGRSRTTFDDMVRLDLRYARTCSIWNDIKILLATPGAVFSGKGAC